MVHESIPDKQSEQELEKITTTEKEYQENLDLQNTSTLESTQTEVNNLPHTANNTEITEGTTERSQDGELDMNAM